MKKILILFLVLVVFSSCVSALQFNVSGGSNFIFNYTDANNVSQNVTFFILASEFNVTSLNLSLNFGQTYTYQNDFINLQAFCQAQAPQEDVCHINRLLEPDETFDVHSGACDLQMKCTQNFVKEDEDVCLGVVPVTIKKDVKLYSLNDNVVFFFDGEEQLFKKNSTFNYETQIEYSCDQPINFTSDEFESGLAQICKESNPFILNWYDKTLNGYIALQSNCDDNKNEARSQLINLEAQIRSANDMKTSCEANGIVNDDKINSCNDAKNQIQSEKQIHGALNIMLAILCGLLFTACVVFAFLYFRQRNLHGGA